MFGSQIVSEGPNVVTTVMVTYYNDTPQNKQKQSLHYI